MAGNYKIQLRCVPCRKGFSSILEANKHYTSEEHKHRLANLPSPISTLNVYTLPKSPVIIPKLKKNLMKNLLSEKQPLNNVQPNPNNNYFSNNANISLQEFEVSDEEDSILKEHFSQKILFCTPEESFTDFTIEHNLIKRSSAEVE